MLKYTLRRILYMIPILFGITLITFVLFNVAGGNPAATAAGRYATAEQIAMMKAQLGLDKPLLQQYVELLPPDLHDGLRIFVVNEDRKFRRCF